jgi:uncharacterized protein (TIGR02118 family)
MLKVQVLVSRRADFTLPEFRSYWKEKHGPLFSSQPEVKQHVRRYVQAHTGQETPQGYALPPFDGIAEISFDNMAGFLGVFASKTYEEIIKPDEMKFLDRRKALFMFTETFPMIGE